MGKVIIEIINKINDNIIYRLVSDTIRSAVTITKEHRQLQVMSCIDLDELACSAEVSMVGS